MSIVSQCWEQEKTGCTRTRCSGGSNLVFTPDPPLASSALLPPPRISSLSLLPFLSGEFQSVLARPLADQPILSPRESHWPLSIPSNTPACVKGNCLWFVYLRFVSQIESLRSPPGASWSLPAWKGEIDLSGTRSVVHSILHLFDRCSVSMLIVSYIESAAQRLCKNLMKDPDKVLSGL